MNEVEALREELEGLKVDVQATRLAAVAIALVEHIGTPHCSTVTAKIEELEPDSDSPARKRAIAYVEKILAIRDNNRA